jgi:sulfur-carrier protein adenylyltransferase/sulfurtransferase
MRPHSPPSLFAAAIPAPGGYRDVDPAALSAARDAVRIVDVREPDELTGELGCIAGVENAPLPLVMAHAAAWRRDEELVLVCRSGGRSSAAARMLASAGFHKVMNLAGGMLAYRAAGLPVAPR